MNDCNHPKLIGTPKSITGNFNSDDDEYWVEFECPDCGKKWTEDQNDITWDREYGNRSRDGFPFGKKQPSQTESNRERFEAWVNHTHRGMMLRECRWHEDKQRYTRFTQADFAFQVWCAAYDRACSDHKEMK